mmetsp:Transcript_5562/g.13927  ORF Transcript_5562/g.13927 Transcript_5562/m.13927 type:complete len:355 (+) Transcript_5562:18-1082(+)
MLNKLKIGFVIFSLLFFDFIGGRFSGLSFLRGSFHLVSDLVEAVLLVEDGRLKASDRGRVLGFLALREGDGWAVASLVVDAVLGEPVQARGGLGVGDGARAADQLVVGLVDDAAAVRHLDLDGPEVEPREVVLSRVRVDSGLNAELSVELVEVALELGGQGSQALIRASEGGEGRIVVQPNEWGASDERSRRDHHVASAESTSNDVPEPSAEPGQASLLAHVVHGVAVRHADHVQQPREGLETAELLLVVQNLVVLTGHHVLQHTLNQLVGRLLVRRALHEVVNLVLQNFQEGLQVDVDSLGVRELRSESFEVLVLHSHVHGLRGPACRCERRHRERHKLRYALHPCLLSSSVL